MKRLALMALALAGPCAAVAEVRSTSVSDVGDRYRIEVSSYLAAPPERVMGVLTDYPRFHRLHPMVISSELLRTEERGAWVRTTYQDCPLYIFCVEFGHTSLFTESSPLHLEANADPAASDFEFAHFEWKAEPEGGGTRLDFSAEVKPAFWLPPFIGGWVLKQRLLEVAKDLQESIQIIAMGGTLPPDWPANRGTGSSIDAN